MRNRGRDEWMERHVSFWPRLGPWGPGRLFASWLDMRFFEGPGWTIHKVTSERHRGLPVHRFHFRYERSSQQGPQTIRGYLDVDPTSWGIVRSSCYPIPNVQWVHDAEYVYAGMIHGIPKLQRMELRSWHQGLDRQFWRPYSLETVEVSQFTELETIDPSQFTLGHYGLGPPYKAVAGITAALLLVAGWVYVLRAWYRQRRRRGLSWEVVAQVPDVAT